MVGQIYVIQRIIDHWIWKINLTGSEIWPITIGMIAGLIGGAIIFVAYCFLMMLPTILDQTGHWKPERDKNGKRKI